MYDIYDYKKLWKEILQEKFMQILHALMRKINNLLRCFRQKIKDASAFTLTKIIITCINIFTGIPEIDIMLLCFECLGLLTETKRPIKILIQKNRLGDVIYMIFYYLLQFAVLQLAVKVISLAWSILF